MEPRQDKTASENDLIVRLKRAEEALRTRELNFQLVVDSIPAPVAVTSPSGEVEGVNQPTLEYFGKTFEELKGWKASDVVHPDDLQHTIDALMKAHETGQRTTLRAAIVALMGSTAGSTFSACPCALLKEKSFAGFTC